MKSKFNHITLIMALALAYFSLAKAHGPQRLRRLNKTGSSSKSPSLSKSASSKSPSSKAPHSSSKVSGAGTSSKSSSTNDLAAPAESDPTVIVIEPMALETTSAPTGSPVGQTVTPLVQYGPENQLGSFSDEYPLDRIVDGSGLSSNASGLTFSATVAQVTHESSPDNSTYFSAEVSPTDTVTDLLFDFQKVVTASGVAIWGYLACSYDARVSYQKTTDGGFEELLPWSPVGPFPDPSPATLLAFPPTSATVFRLTLQNCDCGFMYGWFDYCAISEVLFDV